MAEITRERSGALLRKLFDILRPHPEGMPANKALEALAASEQLSPYEAGVYDSSGGRRFEKIVRFGTVDCVKAGWLVKHKGIWTATDAGLAAYDAFPDPASFYKEAVRLYRQWKASQSGQEAAAVIETADEATSDEDKLVTVTLEQAEEQAWAEIEQYLHGMPPYDFQNLVADLLRAMGHYVGWISPRGKDGGVDIVATPDPLGIQSPRIKVQVKRLGTRVDVDNVRAFAGVVGDVDVGIFVSTGGFTRDAETYARNQERKKVTLIDLEQLVDLWIKFYGKLDDKGRARFPLTPIYFLAAGA
ncbi:restriction endonuclease [Ralstonia sp. Ralssp135]|uniref:restriction endonuclease n=1 Tax=Ralstonia sp. Ralssp135 TaxID=3243016 RepID=UPI0039AEF2E8